MAAASFVDITGCSRVTKTGISLMAQHSGDITVKIDKCWRLHSPNPSLTAQDVVEMQILSLGASAENNEGVHKCFEYASPDNKAHTGPAERFGAMIRQGYGIMMRWHSYTINEQLVMHHDELHRVYKVAFQCEDEQQSFFWSVSKQEDSCWMTDSVMPA
jgi:hypothetical protein